MSTHTATGVKATATADTDDGTPTLTTDDLHHLLSNARRRTILRVLDADGPLPKGELAERVAAAETGKDVGEVDNQERKRALVSIHQCHKPKMIDYGAVCETPDGVALGPTAPRLLPYLDGPERGWFSKALGTVVGRF